MRLRTPAARRSIRAVATAIVLATAVVLPMTPLAPSAAEASATSTAAQPTPSPEPTAAPVAEAAPATASAAPAPAPTNAPTPTSTDAPVPAQTSAPTPATEPARASTMPRSGAAASASAIAPMAVGGPEPTVAAPYLYWSVSPAIAGATFSVEYRVRSGVIFPSWSAWTGVTIADCATSGCTAAGDLDPHAGEFQVQQIGSHRIQNDSWPTRYEYRVTPVDSPSGYGWVSGAARTVAANGSSGATYDLGSFALGSNPPLACTARNFYSLRKDGTVLRVTAGTTSDSATIQAIGSFPGATSANALAIGPGGSVMYAVDRAGSGTGIASVLRYSVADGWERFPVANGSTSVGIVGGAVNPLDGSYYVGGFRTASDRLHVDLYRFDPATSSFAAAGTFNTGVATTTSTTNNGDIAFDATGTLYVLRSSTTDARIFSVQGPAVVNAGRSTVLPFSTISQGGIGALSGVTGIAFEGDGTLYLADATRAIRVNPNAASGWTIAMDPVTTKLENSNDLASCSTPPTLTIQKNVVGRNAATDQFRLLARAGDRILASAETTGTELGLQLAQVGPIPVVAGQTYTIAEEMVSGAASSYASSFRCVDESGNTITSGNGRLGQVAIPQRAGAGIVCTFANAPLVSTVTIRKVVEDTAGNRQSAAEWTMRASVTAEAGTVTPPAAAEQQTSSGGSASWTIRYGSDAARASVAIAEVQRAGHAFVEGSCEVLPATGLPTHLVLRSEAGATLSGIGPGSAVDCTFVNRVLPTTLTLVKSIGYGDASLAGQWRLTGAAPEGARPGPAGTTGSAAATATVTPGAAYALAEAGGPATYAQNGDWSCVNQRGAAVAVARSAVVVAQGEQVTCTVVNATARLTLLKHIDAAHGGALAAGMFSLTATPVSFTGLTATTVRGNETEVATGAGANRFDVRPGHSYTLTEHSDYASLGLRLERQTGPDTWVTVSSPTIQVPAGEHHVYRFVNAPVPALALPLTGGIGADAYALGGGALLLLALALIHFRSRRSAQREHGLS
jgi:LPXTG-motif cell wall-anchored protein